MYFRFSLPNIFSKTDFEDATLYLEIAHENEDMNQLFIN
jgi:hypothetical protein